MLLADANMQALLHQNENQRTNFDQGSLACKTLPSAAGSRATHSLAIPEPARSILATPTAREDGGSLYNRCDLPSPKEIRHVTAVRFKYSTT